MTTSMAISITSDLNTPPSIAIQVNPFGDPEQALQEAMVLSQKYQLPLASELAEPATMLLGWHYEKKDPIPKLALFQKESGPVFIDFVAGKKAHRRQFGGGKGQPLVRAMGKIEQRLPTVLDATAGMGGDSFVLASLGFDVLMIERSKAVSALLKDALSRGKEAVQTASLPPEILEILNRLTIIHADSAHYLLTEKPQIDVIYMDPMYPEKKKNAATKKEMKALQNLVGPDKDSEKLLQAALQTASYRVVVKRPKNAPIIDLPHSESNDSKLDNTKIQPSTHIASPNTRYDIYSIKALKSAGLIA